MTARNAKTVPGFWEIRGNAGFLVGISGISTHGRIGDSMLPSLKNEAPTTMIKLNQSNQKSNSK